MNLIRAAAGFTMFSWWKAKVQDEPYELIGPISGIGAAALVVRVVWGKKMAVFFVPVALEFYSFVHERARKYIVIDQKRAMQLAKSFVIPLLCLAAPFTVRVLLPIQLVLICMMLHEGWRDGQKIEELAKQNKEFAEQTEKLKILREDSKKEIETIFSQSEDLNQALTKLLETKAKKEEETSSYLENMQKAVRLCALIDPEKVKAQLRERNRNEQEIGRLTGEANRLEGQIEERNKQLQGLIQQIGDLTPQYQEPIARVLELERKAQERENI